MTFQEVWDRASIIEAIQGWTRRYGRPPTMAQWRQAYDLPHDRRPAATTVWRVFGTWNAGIAAAGLTPRPALRDAYKWPPEEILDAIRRWADLHGSPPNSMDWRRSHEDYPPFAQVRRHFGTWNAAVIASGLTPRGPRGRLLRPPTDQ